MHIIESLESNVRSYVRCFPTMFDTAKGSVLSDTEGNEFIDFFSGAGTLNYGHNPPIVNQALIDYLQHNGIVHSLDKATVARQKMLFEKDPQSRWKKMLGKARYEAMLDSIRVASEGYGMFYVKDAEGNTLRNPETGEAVLLSAKMHNKTFIAGVARRVKRKDGKYELVYAIVDGSANATDSSLKNQEFIMTIVHQMYSRLTRALFRGLYALTSAEKESIKAVTLAGNNKVRRKAGLKEARSWSQLIKFNAAENGTGDPAKIRQSVQPSKPNPRTKAGRCEVQMLGQAS